MWPPKSFFYLVLPDKWSSGLQFLGAGQTQADCLVFLGPLSPFQKEAQIESDVCRTENQKVLCTCRLRLPWEVTLLPQGQGWEPSPEPEDGLAGADQETGSPRVGAVNKGGIWPRRALFFPADGHTSQRALSTANRFARINSRTPQAALRGQAIVIPSRQMRNPRHRKTKPFAKVKHSVSGKDSNSGLPAPELLSTLPCDASREQGQGGEATGTVGGMEHEVLTLHLPGFGRPRRRWGWVSEEEKEGVLRGGRRAPAGSSGGAGAEPQGVGVPWAGSPQHDTGWVQT